MKIEHDGSKVYQSRRGDYVLTGLPDISIMDFEFTKGHLQRMYPQRIIDVQDEILYALQGRLEDHKYWKDEPLSFVKEYEKLYCELWDLKWLHDPAARHNIVVNAVTCVTLVQYHDRKLIVYSRSTDMKNGYHSDRIMMVLLAQHIRDKMKGYTVDNIYWVMAVPHEYTEKGIARLKQGDRG